MMRDLIDRFRYRFQLWWREQREDFTGQPARLADLGEPSIWDDPKYEVLLAEPTHSFIVREASLYVGVILIVSNISFLIDKFFPGARHAVGVTFIVLVGVWTLLTALMIIDL